jgi:signal transduction histidine kinase
MAGDGNGKVWISDSTLGLVHLTPGDEAQPIPWSKFGQKNYGPQSLAPDRLGGGLWLGFLEGGVAYFKDGRVRLSYKAADGLGNGRVDDLRFDSAGSLWAATETGLSRIKDGRIMTLTNKNGLPCDQVHWSIEDEDHFVWLYMPCGLVRIARSELDAWIADPSSKVQLTIFDGSDGVISIGTYGGYGPHVTKSPDGRIWFIAHDAVSVIDPQHLPHNKVPPPVHIEQITADGKTYDASKDLRLPSLVRDLTIDYTALSLVVPEKVHFRFKLEGQDKDWREVVNDRQVQYSNLAPKHYRFLVKACNNSGVWNEEGAALDFVIPPAWYQTNWFRALCVAAFLGLLWALYQYRLHQLAQQFDMRLEERVGERTRIARDLHDTLLQSCHGILLFLQSGIHLLDEHPAEAKKTLKTAAEQAERAIIEGREAVQGLRASTVERNDLALAIKTLGGELAAADSSSQRPEFNVQVEGIPRNLHPILRDEVFRIAGEAMRNAFRHADAKQIEVEIRYDERQLRLRVRDDGKGIDPKLLSHDGWEGHFGLRGMRERAKLIGGKLTVWSELDSGTEVELSLPASRAYTAPDGQRSWLAEKLAKLSGKDAELKS